MGTKLTSTALLLLLCLWCGCNRAVPPAGYISFLEKPDNGYRKELTAGQWLYKVQYKPAAYIYLQEKHGNGASEQEYQQRAKQLEGWCFFNIYTGHTKDRHASPVRLLSTGLEDYNKYLSYYLNENKANFRLTADADTIYPTIYVFENNYNLSPEDVFVLGFKLRDQHPAPENLSLIYNDAVLGTGIVRFSFNKADLKKEPQIQFN